MGNSCGLSSSRLLSDKVERDQAKGGDSRGKESARDSLSRQRGLRPARWVY